MSAPSELYNPFRDLRIPSKATNPALRAANIARAWTADARRYFDGDNETEGERYVRAALGKADEALAGDLSDHARPIIERGRMSLLTVVQRIDQEREARSAEVKARQEARRDRFPRNTKRDLAFHHYADSLAILADLCDFLGVEHDIKIGEMKPQPYVAACLEAAKAKRPEIVDALTEVAQADTWRKLYIALGEVERTLTREPVTA